MKIDAMALLKAVIPAAGTLYGITLEGSVSDQLEDAAIKAVKHVEDLRELKGAAKRDAAVKQFQEAALSVLGTVIPAAAANLIIEAAVALIRK